jgi:heterodisulfide reductase subunit A
MAKIGFFICDCGENIARTVDVERVAETIGREPNVVHSTHYKYMCSDPGQELVRQAIREHELTGVVVAACSPRMHEATFRRAAAESGLNPYRLEMANVREHCSWVHSDREAATQKAAELARMMVAKVKRAHDLVPVKVPVTKRVLVLGGGIAGIQAALDVAASGHEVILVEREPSIGGHMAQLSETFPTLDCSQCIMTPRMVEIAQNPRITLLTFAELAEVGGFVGNFEVKIRMKARSVDLDKCTGCGLCTEKCPSNKIPSEFDEGLSNRTAIYIPFPQAVPHKPAIDREHCIYFSTGKCGVCAKVCPTGAIDCSMADEIVEEKVGAIIVATGYRMMRTHFYGEYTGGRDPDIITGLQFERLASASGPTSGEIKRPSDGKVPETVLFIQCAGSRDPSKGVPYCSKICCMYTAKHAMLYKHKVHEGRAVISYMDIRAGGKGYEEFTLRAREEDEALYIRGRVSRLYRRGGKLVALATDTLVGEQVEIEADMVVLATAVQAQADAAEIAQTLGISYDAYGFMSEAHPKLRPVESSSAGIFLAGACQAPKDIPDSVAQASAAAAKVGALLSSDELEREPIIAHVSENTCVACWYCVNACPYTAIEKKELRDRQGNLLRMVAHVNEGLCAGCGVCAATCPSNSVDLAGFTDEEMFDEVMSLTEV